MNFDNPDKDWRWIVQKGFDEEIENLCRERRRFMVKNAKNIWIWFVSRLFIHQVFVFDWFCVAASSYTSWEKRYSVRDPAE